MYETYSTVVGTVITNPQRRFTQGGEEVISFRVASTVRYKGPGADNWLDGSTLYLTVTTAWTLAERVIVRRILDPGVSAAQG